jgi:hypothetical protein
MENTTNLELFGVLGIVSENAESILTYSKNTRKVFKRIWRIPPKKEYCSILLIFQEFKKFKIRPQAFSPFTHLYVVRRTLVTKAEMYCGKDRAA